MSKSYKYKIGPELHGRVHAGNTLHEGMVYESEFSLTGPGFNLIVDEQPAPVIEYKPSKKGAVDPAKE